MDLLWRDTTYQGWYHYNTTRKKLGNLRIAQLLFPFGSLQFWCSIQFCSFLVHQQKRCNWCIVPFALDCRAVTRIRGKHRRSVASNLHFPAYIRGYSMTGTAQTQDKNANRHARRKACKSLCKMGVRFVRLKWNLKLRDIFWYQMS